MFSVVQNGHGARLLCDCHVEGTPEQEIQEDLVQRNRQGVTEELGSSHQPNQSFDSLLLLCQDPPVCRGHTRSGTGGSLTENGNGKDLEETLCEYDSMLLLLVIHIEKNQKLTEAKEKEAEREKIDKSTRFSVKENKSVSSQEHGRSTKRSSRRT